MNIVVIKHFGSTKHYLFAVPEGKNLLKDDMVLVRNSRGFAEGMCVCDSLEVSDSAANAIGQLFKAKFPLGMVVGKYSFESFDTVMK